MEVPDQTAGDLSDRLWVRPDHTDYLARIALIWGYSITCSFLTDWAKAGGISPL